MSNGFPDGFSSLTRFLPRTSVDRTNQPRMTRSLRSTPTAPQQELPSYYEPVRRRARHRYSIPHGFIPLETLPAAHLAVAGSRTRLLAVPHKSSSPGSRRLHAGHHPASRQAPAGLIPVPKSESRFRCHLNNFDASTATLADARAAHRLPGPHLTHRVRLFPLAHHDSLQLTQQRVV